MTEDTIKNEADKGDASSVLNDKVDAILNNELTDAEKLENQTVYNNAMNKLNSFGLDWTFRSIRYVLNNKNISFGQLRSCVYTVDNKPVFDYLTSIEVLIEAGLIGSKQCSQSDKAFIDNKVNDIIDSWMQDYSLSSLHLLIIHVMETKHFFTDMQDMRIVKYLSSKNLQSDLVEMTLKNEVAERMSQAAALMNN